MLSLLIYFLKLFHTNDSGLVKITFDQKEKSVIKTEPVLNFKILKLFFLFTDISFIVYWLITLLHLIPDEYLFKDYNNPLLISWNWSFFPLDISISFSGLLSLFLHKMNDNKWKITAIASLVLTFCSGLQAISFWTIRLDFDPIWWLPNLYLLIYPIFFIAKLFKKECE